MANFAAISVAARSVSGRVLLGLLAALAGTAGNARGDVFRLLDDDGESLQARVDLIQQAGQEVCAAYYAADSGRASAAVLFAMRGAARRGVRVRLVVDGMFSRIPASLEEHLIAEGIEIREYHPVQLTRPVLLNQRMHSKLLVVDGRQIIVGSRNLEDHHFGFECVNFVDRDAYVCGQAACCARAYFMSLWESDEVAPVRLGGFHPLYLSLLKRKPDDCGCFAKEWQACSPAKAACALDEAAAALVCRQAVRFDACCDWSAGRSADLPVRFLYDCCLDKHSGSIKHDMLHLIDAARCDLVIETPYPVFPEATKRAILAARSRGVAVRLLTNSLNSTDLVSTYAAHQNHKKMFLRAGVEIWELEGPDHLHAKSMVIDGRIAVVGSDNFDVRGAASDLEVAVAVEDPAAAAEVAASIQEHMADAWRIGPDGKPVGADQRHPGAEPEKVRKLQRQRPVVPLFRRLL